MLAHLEYKEMFENTDCKLTAPGFQETGSGYWIEGITKGVGIHRLVYQRVRTGRCEREACANAR